MPGCSAEYCTNSTAKGFKMLYFPLDVERRAPWIANVNRADWVPTHKSTLCEVHFAQDMWERPRVDGSKKLKSNAIPTIFGDEATIKTLEPKEKTKKLTDSNVPHVELDSFKNNIAPTEIQADVTPLIEKIVDAELKVKETDSDELCSEDTIGEDDKNRILTNSETINVKENDRYKKLEKLWLKSERLRKRLTKKLRAAKIEIKRLRSSNVRTDPCRMIFNKDQIQLLRSKYKKLPRWCNASLLKAYQLKFACGTSGYQELLKQKYPLPSLWTLSRKLEGLKFQPGICEKIFEFLRITENRI